MNTYRVELLIMEPEPSMVEKVKHCNIVASCIEDAGRIAIRLHGGILKSSRKLFAGSPAD